MENESEMLRNMVEQSPQGVYIIKIIKDEETGCSFIVMTLWLV